MKRITLAFCGALLGCGGAPAAVPPPKKKSGCAIGGAGTPADAAPLGLLVALVALARRRVRS